MHDPASPFERFSAWLAEATAQELNDPNGMALATASDVSAPSVRMVLLKGLDGPEHSARGFVFYTNLGSRKAAELIVNPLCGLLFHWKSLRRQIRIEGEAQPVSPQEADVYFASRPRLSRLGAWASDQSRPLPERAVLEERLAEQQARFADDIPRPPHWSGFRVVPASFEFWTDMPFRLHDRMLFTRAEGGWNSSLLYP